MSNTALNDCCPICGLELELSATPATAAATGTCSSSCAGLLDELRELEDCASEPWLEELEAA